MKPALAMLLTLIGGLFAASPEWLFTDDFEGPSWIRWSQTWGPARRSRGVARSGEWAVRQEVEDRYGLSVWYTEFDTTPGTIYTVTAWVYVPAQTPAVIPKLSLNRLDWSTLSAASTDVVNQWVELKVIFENASESRVRLQLYQAGQQAGIGGALMIWDDVSVRRQRQPVDPAAGSRINPLVKHGLEVTPAGGMTVRVEPGVMLVGGRPVTVTEAVVLELEPPRRIAITDEKTLLTDETPRGYGRGTALERCRSRGTTIKDVLDAESLRIKSGPGEDGMRYREGRDWRADKAWGRVGRLPGGRIGADTPVYIDYAISLMRIDTLAVRSDGAVIRLRGNEHKMTPEPPRVDMYAAALCNVFVPYHCTELAVAHLYPLGPRFPDPGIAVLQAQAARIPRTRAKLEAGADLTIVFWGDSVTCGGDASDQEYAFPLSFTNWLRGRFPASRIDYVNAGTGGWNSTSKLPLFEAEVLARRPDLVVIEFVNDMGFSRDQIFRNYSEALTRIREIGGEVIILTPHFTRPDWMGAGDDMRTPETRAAVSYLREFAEKDRVGLADASRRWEHLWVEGLPYLTLLYNAINHPDDRGHQLFVDELKRFFLAVPGDIHQLPVEPLTMPAGTP